MSADKRHHDPAYWAAKWAEARQREVELHGHWFDRLLEGGAGPPVDIVPVAGQKRRVLIKRRPSVPPTSEAS
ncbi:hypothetical protein FBZ90_106193 [Nitrospirillum pindoramense]|uniref:Uncharacterized protein n=1 Tax=Nitrospirillum amazonense TaxID=28077 RepID=A0A560H8E4_9PROT|nr:hypothetical protein FBZ90_106193 [Nitrospirillum amazonense]